MLLAIRVLTALGLLLHGVNGGGYAHVQTTVTDTIVEDVTRYVEVTVYSTKTDVITTCVTEYTTTTLHYTVSVTQTNSATVTATETDYATVTNTDTDYVTITNTGTDYVTITNTETDSVTITDTDTDSVTITNTETDSATITNTETDSTTVTTTDTVPATITTFTTQVQTIFSTTVDPCPKYCSISAERVNLYFWPTNRPYTYPTTHVDEVRGLGAYTFTSPTVYMFIPTAVGTNTAGATVGPETANWMLPLDLYEVSTIATAAGNATRQLTLADLGTKCPQTFDPTAIATLGGPSACDPMLAAPTQVRNWAYPCNACGRFGLFDPPYAVPTITGSLVVPTTTVPPPPPVTVTVPTATATAPPPPPPPGTGQIFIVYCDEEGRPFGTATVPAPGVSGSITSSVTVPGECAATSTPLSSLSSVTATATGSVTTAGAARHIGGDGLAKWAVPGAVAALAWL
ncbi:hypothetical protein B0T16DRAFT_193091 [Cercophora newfieldiana]|uniref:Uncharacterized protein n=1 Tax=Cercophora newfieldiana TaxID=92897 RepID=A0AA40CNR8_9PEZI|nr:hypothetical protein B0T16DRAFT_193091 [Cercophora newfieldiana]